MFQIEFSALRSLLSALARILTFPVFTFLKWNMMIVCRLADTTSGSEELVVQRGARSYYQNVQSFPVYM